MPRIFRPNSTFSRTVFQGNSEYCWNTMPRSALGPFTRSPSTVTIPVVGLRKPATALSRVDFPQPEGPTIDTNSPGFTWICVSVTAWTGPSMLS
ncbi:hypothetical protein ACVWXP_004655 [Bradyrhizobium sp. USDA 4463]